MVKNRSAQDDEITRLAKLADNTKSCFSKSTICCELRVVAGDYDRLRALLNLQTHLSRACTTD